MTTFLSPSAYPMEHKDLFFQNLPPGWRLTESFTVSDNESQAIGKKLDASIDRLSNSILKVNGQNIQVNIIKAASKSDAVKIHSAIARMKGHPSFCIRKGMLVIEYTGRNISAALAEKVSYELGFVSRPDTVIYRVTADLALIDEADYMWLNKMFNLFLQFQKDPGNKQIRSKIRENSKRFQFGDQITLRNFAQGETGSDYSFSTVPANQRQDESGEIVKYAFNKMSHVLGIPYVTVTMNIPVHANGVMRTKRRADDSLLAATSFWPADDPEIMALAKKITSGKKTQAQKVDTILKWLSPGKNIKYGGNVTGSRWGVKQVLKKKRGHCWDFSDCFVTLCRASRIPCRQVAGWFYGTSGHVWAEVLWEGKGWKQVDPTGGGRLKCGIYHIPYFTTEDGHMPIMYVSQPKIEMRKTK